MSTQTIETQVVLEFCQTQLLSGRADDFVREPVRGIQFVHEGELYEVINTIETVGAPPSPRGSVLLDVLNMLYPQEKAVRMHAGMQRIEPVIDASSKGGIATTGLSLIITAAPRERLLYVQLTKVGAPSNGTNLWRALTEGDAHSRAGFEAKSGSVGVVSKG